MSEGVDQANDPQVGGIGTDRNEELSQAQSVVGDGGKSAILQQAQEDAGLTVDTDLVPDEEALEQADRSV